MFDPAGIKDPGSKRSIEEPYAEYMTTNYPITYVVFANLFADWLLGKDHRDRLGILDLIEMIQEVSYLEIKVVPRSGGTLVIVRSHEFSHRHCYERVFVEN